MNVDTSIQQRKFKLLLFFVLAWMTLNILQSLFTGIYPDEAYYWVYSRHLQWGYFDHPPMVALFIRAGELLAHNSFTTRIGTVLLSAGAFFFLIRSDTRRI